MRRKKALVFDIDGTLVNSGIDWGRIKKLLKDSVGIDVDGRPLAVVLSSLPERARKILESVVRDAEVSSAARIEPDPTLKELMAKAKRLGYSVAVVSLRARDTAFQVLDRLGIKGYVDALVTRDETPRRDSQLVIALKELGVGPEDSIFFGDTPWDAEVAAELGLRFIRITGDGRVGRPPENLLRILREVLGVRQ